MDLKQFHKLIALLRTQSTTSVDMCLTKLDLLLAIAADPGLASAEYARAIDLPTSSVNRHLRELRAGASGKSAPKEGLGLVEAKTNATDWRKNEVYLSRKGRLLIDQMLALAQP